MRISDALHGDVVVFEFSGKIMADDLLTWFQGQVHYYLNLNKKRFIIDLRNVEWMSSSGLGALITAFTSVKKADGRLVLANITNIQNLLNITQLVRVFDAYDSRDEAVQAIN